MLGKVMVAGGIAGVAAYSKLKGMDSTELGQVGNRIAGMVSSLAENTSKSEFVAEIRERLEQTQAGSVVVGAVDKFMAGAVPATQDAVQKFFGTMSEAKAKAERGDGTFGRNLAESFKDGAVNGLQTAISTGMEFIAEKIAPAGTEQPAVVTYDAEAPGFEVDEPGDDEEYVPC